MGSKAKMFKWSQTITPAQVVKLMRAEKDVEKATSIFNSATAEYANGFCHDQSSFGYMVLRLVSANKFRAAEDLVERMKKESCVINEDILLSICRGYGRVHRPLDSLRVFHKMKDFGCNPTQKSCITVFAILVEENQLKVAFRFYKYMREVGLQPTVASLNVLIKALCRNGGTIDAGLKIFREMPKRGCNPDSYTYGTLINGLCRFGRIAEAKCLIKEMGEKDCAPSVVTYTSLIHGLCESKNVMEAMGLLEEMKCKGIEPNVFTYSSLMDGLCKDGRALQAMELFEMMVARSCKPNMVTYSTLITGLCKEQKLQEATELLDRMKLQGLKPDAGLYGKTISGFCGVSKFREAANFLDEMILGGITPNRLTWSIHVRINNEVVRGLCTSDPSRAFSLYLSMRTRGISVEAETSDSLVKCLCKKRELQKAVQIVNEMVTDGCIPDKGTWKLLVGQTLEKMVVQEASESLLREFEIQDQDL
ncbi:PREDICTED: pentatricopeptide repeat-containing protein At5g46100 [Tarenaya hassleriana]|uniref:pentatricopeptide repeat-containing protein At5g46100 n=1 Tax=Tarenaya hassleriana TaxID=28532 RepID=UPI00053C6732|nr:PREDICTED: pentatricopeptide repeat-containing protein At5g46100 [Tarenaya hassleriana]